MSPPPVSPPPPGLELLQREAFERLFARVAKVRAVLVPLVSLLLVHTFWEEPTLWRKGVLAGMVAMAAVLGVIEYRRYWRPRQRQGLPLGYVAGVTLPILGSMLLVTGGLEGPLMPVVVVVGFIITLFLEPRHVWLYAAGGVTAIWCLAALALYGALPDLIPRLYGGGTRAGHNDALLLAHATVLTVLVLWVAGIGSILRDVFQDMVRDARSARDEVLHTQAEAVRSLTTLSGEIAHELKNPLASVKGLAAMIARDVEGKPAERLAVLRREVDRMQEVLEGFLNFSRPLLPLTLQRVALEELCRQVVELHEGMAVQRGLLLRLFAEQPVSTWCDPRKVKQVVINLVQNALEASPRGSTVELVVLGTPEGGARIEVRDRGPGIPEAVRARVLEPGVTTKETGSGLGLAIARALALQHGGELALRGREGGGCVAELVLPPGAPRGERSEAA